VADARWEIAVAHPELGLKPPPLFTCADAACRNTLIGLCRDHAKAWAAVVGAAAAGQPPCHRCPAEPTFVLLDPAIAESGGCEEIAYACDAHLPDVVRLFAPDPCEGPRRRRRPLRHVTRQVTRG
jgi:hypothetical protein